MLQLSLQRERAHFKVPLLKGNISAAVASKICSKSVTRTRCEEHPSHQVVEAADHLPLLEVGLSVQRGGLDVAQAVGVAGAQQQHVSGEDLVTSQPDEVSHPHLLPVFLHIASLCSSTTIRGQMSGVSCGMKDVQLLFSTI